MLRANKLFALAIVFAPSSAGAFETLKTNGGAQLLWRRLPVEYSVVFTSNDEAGEAFSSAARSSFDRWSFTPGSSAAAIYRGPAENAVPGDGVATVVLDRTWDPAWGDAARSIAFTELTYDTRTGTISDADLHLNAERFSFSSTTARGVFDSETVIVHEIGHLFGLAHSCGDPGTSRPSCFDVPDDPPGTRDRILNAVMAPGVAPGVERRVLNDDDRAGIAALYPGTRTDPVFWLQPAVLDCKGGRWVASGRDLEGLSFELRYADGTSQPITPAISEPTKVHFAAGEIDKDRGTVDLIARGSNSAASVINFLRPTSCNFEPVVEDDAGCACTSGTKSGVAIVGLMLLLVRRRR